MGYSRIALVVGVFALATPAFGDGMVQWGGKLWTKFTYDLRDGADPKSGFDIYRGFLTAKIKHSDQWRTQLTLDSKSTGTKLHLIHTPAALPNTTIFHGFIEGKNLLANDKFRFGIQPSSYIIPVYKNMGTRWLGMLLAQEAGLIGSHQAGISWSATFAENVTATVQAHDGRKGYGKASDHGGGVAVTLNAKIADPLSLLAHYEHFMEKTMTADDGTETKNPATNVAAVALLAKAAGTKLAIEATYKTESDNDEDALGYGATVNGEFGMLGAVARIYSGNEAFQTALKAKHLIGVGPTLQIGKHVDSALVFERRQPVDTDADALDTVSLVFRTKF